MRGALYRYSGRSPRRNWRGRGQGVDRRRSERTPSARSDGRRLCLSRTETLGSRAEDIGFPSGRPRHALWTGRRRWIVPARIATLVAISLCLQSIRRGLGGWFGRIAGRLPSGLLVGRVIQPALAVGIVFGQPGDHGVGGHGARQVIALDDVGAAMQQILP